MAREHVDNKVLLLRTLSNALADVTAHLSELLLGWIFEVFYVASVNAKKSKHSLDLGCVCID